MSVSFSVIIPVFNKWELTRRCLASLASCTREENFEVLVADNASGDETVSACAPTGRALFGTRFKHLRFETNLNFAGACNRGAAAAEGERLFFLNNDTVLTPDWLEPLLRAFTEEERLGAVGPLLLYPECEGFRDRVQHLGVAFGPTMHVCHLYEGIPAAHPLACRQRFFQAVTAAAVMLPKALFWAVGAFDEGYINGFEDLDLCARLGASGWKMTCSPKSRIYHLCGQTPGRSAHDAANSRLLGIKRGSQLVPDKHAFLESDGYRLRLTPWLTYVVEGKQETVFRLHARSGKTAQLPPEEQILQWSALLEEEPYWMESYLRLAAILESKQQMAEALRVLLLATRFRDTPETLLPLWRLARRAGQAGLARAVEQKLKDYAWLPEDERIRSMRRLRARFRGEISGLSEDAHAFLAHADVFHRTQVLPLQAELSDVSADHR